jgi:zinc finger HIT domain-containing protein 1
LSIKIALTPERRGMSRRTSTLSKAMRVVDEDTRKHVQQKRLAALEADNYQEETFDEEEDDEGDGSSKRKKARTNYQSKSGSAVLKRKPKSLERILDEERYSKGVIDYDRVAAGPSTNPRRHFCSVCGYIGDYTCTRCGSRFCSIRCNNNHKETRCLKFSI